MKQLISTASALNARAAGSRTIACCLLMIATGVSAGLFGWIEPSDAIRYVFEGVIGVFMRLGISSR